MRYYLIFYKENYYIIQESEATLLEQCICQVAPAIASVKANNIAFAYKHLFAVALSHHLNRIKDFN